MKWFVLDAQAVNDIDITGAEALQQVFNMLKARGVTVAVSRANPSTTASLENYHLMKLIGNNRLFPTNRHAIEAFRKEMGRAMSETTT